MDLEPPRQLSLPARQTWDRHATRIYSEGRWNVIDQDLLCVYAETLQLYQELKADVDRHGTLVPGRGAQELVRNPSLMGWAACRTDLIRLSRAIPLVNANPNVDGIAIDQLIESYAS
jgi:phage terminase small subunit